MAAGAVRGGRFRLIRRSTPKARSGARRKWSPPTWRVTRFWLVVSVLLAAGLVAGYMLWFRDSSLVAIEKVDVTGSNLSPAVEGELSSAAIGLSTLHLDRSALEAAVADDPSVVALKVETDFPHGVTIDVQSRTPAGWLDADGGALIAADGMVLETGVEQPDGLPTIDGEASDLGGRATGSALAAARVLGEAPGPLQPEIDTARVDAEHGVVVDVTGGIELRFGDPGNADQKWKAASTVLADPGLTSATYIDLSVPSRPVVG